MNSDSLSLLAHPAPAVLATYRKDGSAAVSPVWFRLRDDTVQVVLAAGTHEGHVLTIDSSEVSQWNLRLIVSG